MTPPLLDCINTLSPEELEQFKDTIGECLARELALATNRARGEQAVKDLAQTNSDLAMRLSELKEAADLLATHWQATHMLRIM